MIASFGLWYVAPKDAYGSTGGGVFCCEHRVEHVKPACSFGLATPRLVFDLEMLGALGSMAVTLELTACACAIVSV